MDNLFCVWKIMIQFDIWVYMSFEHDYDVIVMLIIYVICSLQFHLKSGMVWRMRPAMEKYAFNMISFFKL